MKRFIILAVVTVVIVGTASAQFAEQLDTVDGLLDVDAYDEAWSILQSLDEQAESNQQKAEVYWRMSKTILGFGDLQIDAEEPVEDILATFERGESYADRAIAADPGNHLGYYWKSANIGKWGKTKGILDSLFKAGPMRDLLVETIDLAPNHADSYYVLGQLYEKVPGVISFGNADYSVSLGRRSVDLMEEELDSGEREMFSEDFYIQLAAHLIARNWNERKRDREHPNKARNFGNADSELQRGFYYEGTVDIPAMDDDEEAAMILEEMIERLESMSEPRPTDLRRLAEARELLSGL